MIPCSACYLSAALTAEVKVLIEALGHLLDLQLFWCVKNALSCSSRTVLHAPAFVGVTTKGPDPLPHSLREQTNQWNPCKAEYRFQSIRFNNILDTGLEEPVQLRVHLSLTLWEGQYPLLYPQLKLDCLFQYLALLGTCLAEWICTGRLPWMASWVIFSNPPHGLFTGLSACGMEKSKKGKLLRGKVRAILLPHEDRTFCYFLFYTDLQNFDLIKERMTDPLTETFTPLSYTYALFSPLFANITKKAFISPGQGDISVFSDDITGISHLLSVCLSQSGLFAFSERAISGVISRLKDHLFCTHGTFCVARASALEMPDLNLQKTTLYCSPQDLRSEVSHQASAVQLK